MKEKDERMMTRLSQDDIDLDRMMKYVVIWQNPRDQYLSKKIKIPGFGLRKRNYNKSKRYGIIYYYS